MQRTDRLVHNFSQDGLFYLFPYLIIYSNFYSILSQIFEDYDVIEIDMQLIIGEDISDRLIVYHRNLFSLILLLLSRDLHFLCCINHHVNLCQSIKEVNSLCSTERTRMKLSH